MNSKPVNYKEAVEYIESIPKFTQIGRAHV